MPAIQPSPRNAENNRDLNREITGGNMDILPLLIAKSLSKTPFAINQEGMEKRPQPEAELPAIDFALLSKVTRENKQSNRSRGTFAGRPAPATM
jgi:hypothetical protein